MTAENTVYTSSLQMGGIVGSCSSNITGCTQRGGALSANIPKGRGNVGGIVGYFNSSSAQIHTCRNESSITATGLYAASFSAGALAGYNFGKIYSCSTFPDDLTIIVKGTAQSPCWQPVPAMPWTRPSTPTDFITSQNASGRPFSKGRPAVLRGGAL